MWRWMQVSHFGGVPDRPAGSHTTLRVPNLEDALGNRQPPPTTLTFTLLPPPPPPLVPDGARLFRPNRLLTNRCNRQILSPNRQQPLLQSLLSPAHPPAVGCKNAGGVST